MEDVRVIVADIGTENDDLPSLTIPGWVLKLRRENRVTTLQRDILAFVLGNCRRGNATCNSNEWLARQFGYSLSEASRAVTALVRMGLLERDIPGRHGQFGGRIRLLRPGATALSHAPSGVAKLPSPVKERRKLPGWVYVLRAEDGSRRYKIGHSRRPIARATELGTKLPFPVTLLCVVQSDDMQGLEDALHERFAESRLEGEWFELDETQEAALLEDE